MPKNNNIKIFTVFEITAKIKNLMRNNFPSIYIKGEISNLKPYPSGHIYFSLKDEKAVINCVIWHGDSKKIKFKLENGLKIIAFGGLNVYEPRGVYNFIIKEITPEGKGELQLAFEQLKEKLQKEGLFLSEHKKKLPEFPQKIGIVTGLQTAALRDILNIINRRFPGIHILIYPAVVQGEQSARTIVKGIKVFNKFFPVDVLMISRGGGSIEDLWSFNEENVARAIFESEIPVITGIGHEIDYTIADFVSDKRAPTPSSAAELAVKNKDDIYMSIKHMQDKLYYFIEEKMNSCKMSFDLPYGEYKNKSGNILKVKVSKFELLFQEFIQTFSGRVSKENHRFINLYQSFRQNIQNRIVKEKNRLEQLSNKCALLNPFLILERGYSITYKMPENIILKDTEEIHKQDTLRVKLFKGEIDCRVVNKKRGE